MDSIAQQGGIYAIFGPNGIYIGSAIQFRKRWNFHWSLLRRGKHHATHLQHAYNKYGAERIRFVVVEVVSDLSILYAVEQRYLDALFQQVNRQCIYNVTQHANGSTGRKATPEARQRMSAFQKGRKRSLEVRQNMSMGRKGLQFTQAHCDNAAIKKSKGKRYTAVAPDGTQHSGIINLARFGREHGLSKSALHNVAAGLAKVHKGWKLIREE